MRLPIRSALVLTLAVAGCADLSSTDPGEITDNAETATEPNAIATESQALASIDIGDGSQVRFYEPEPGVVVKVHILRIGETMPEYPAGETAVETFERLAKKPAPLALVQAQGRSRQLPSNEGERSEVRVGLREPPARIDHPNPSSQKSVSDENQWWRLTCGQGWGIDLSRNKVFENRLANGSQTGQLNDMKYVDGAVANFQGATMSATFKVRPRLTWSPGITWTLAENQWTGIVHGGDGGTIAALAKYDAKFNISNPFGAFHDVCLWGQYK